MAMKSKSASSKKKSSVKVKDMKTKKNPKGDKGASAVVSLGKLR